MTPDNNVGHQELSDTRTGYRAVLTWIGKSGDLGGSARPGRRVRRRRPAWLLAKAGVRLLEVERPDPIIAYQVPLKSWPAAIWDR